ncbi:MAG: YbaK/EbsC family protein [Pseudomonadota bacterium]
MSDTLPHVRSILESTNLPFEVWDCDNELADTAAFCAHYNVSPGQSANAILVRSKEQSPQWRLCVVLATHKLDVNKAVRKTLGVKKVSFASAEETREKTSMEIGGVTPIGLPDDLIVWVDEAVMKPNFIILGGGNRTSKLKVSPEIFRQLPNVEVIENLAIPRE